MTKEQEIIIQKIKSYLIANPGVRFCQALQNLNINQNDNSRNVDINNNYMLRDNFYDTDEEVISRFPKNY